MTLWWKRLTTLAILSTLLAAEAQAQRGNWQKQLEPALQGDEVDAANTKQALERILKAYPPALKQVLQLDPSLLTNTTYLAPYPTLVGFLNEHAVVARNPAYFLGVPQSPKPASTPSVTYVYPKPSADPLSAYVVVFALLGIVAWMIRAVIDHQRWLKSSRAQSETQSKILDRFTSNEDLLNFIQTPAGKHLLESSSVPPQPQSVTAPIQQILWSVKVGIVLFTGGAGLEIAGVYQVVSVLMMAVGLGFIFSAMSSWVLSKKLGLLGSTEATPQAPPN